MTPEDEATAKPGRTFAEVLDQVEGNTVEEVRRLQADAAHVHRFEPEGVYGYLPCACGKPFPLSGPALVLSEVLRLGNPWPLERVLEVLATNAARDYPPSMLRENEAAELREAIRAAEEIRRAFARVK